MNSEPNQLGPSLLFIYFMIGFVVGVLGCMILLMFIRPYLPVDAFWVKALVITPLITGGLLGRRVVRFGKQYQIPLWQALLLALGFREVE